MRLKRILKRSERILWQRWGNVRANRKSLVTLKKLNKKRIGVMNKELNRNVIENAVKVTSFLKLVREICKTNNLNYPADEEIAEWIDGGGELNALTFLAGRMLNYKFNKFVADLESEGMTDLDLDDVKAFYEKYGDNVGLYVDNYIIKKLNKVERLTYTATIDKLTTMAMVKLWNTFLEESALYGDDSYIYDLNDDYDLEVLKDNMKHDELEKVKKLRSENVRYIQWANLNDNEITKVDNIKRTLLGFWTEIFEHIMVYPSAYNFKLNTKLNMYSDGDGRTYLDDVFFPALAREIGYDIDPNRGTIKKLD